MFETMCCVSQENALNVTSMTASSRNCIENVYNCAQYSHFYIETAAKLKYNVGISVRFYVAFMGDYVSKMSHCAY